MNLLQSLLLAVALPLFMLLNPMGALAAELFICEGQPLSAEVYNGAVDAAGIPNSNGGTVPGAFILIRWGEFSLQLPRTNNAGVPSYTDGRWWWQAIDSEHPDLAELSGFGGEVKHYSCNAA